MVENPPMKMLMTLGWFTKKGFTEGKSRDIKS
jgi:hypothetical protein